MHSSEANEYTEAHAISMGLGVELVIWFSLIAISLFFGIGTLISNTWDVVLYGGAAIAISYLVATLVGVAFRIKS
ncbi:hypothetical protein [Undibacterium sp. Ji49W]|uniref:hypothetical protein n=1 Tax=Undibacterium sp. Ji49W TaxID=3413040 RepID=UPI003BF372B8